MMAELGNPDVVGESCGLMQVGIFDIDDYRVHIFFHDPTVKSLLEEAQSRGVPIGGLYSAVKHSPHTPNGMHHLHFYAKGNQIGALNIDGTTHDAWHGRRLPNKVIKGIAKHFPEFIIPPDGVLEEVEPDIADYLVLLEIFN